MKKTTLTLITLAIFALSCNQTRRQPTIPENLSEIIEKNGIIAYTDSIIQGENVRIFGQDSMFVFGRRGEVARVIYLNPRPYGDVRFRAFGSNEIEIAFTTNRPLADEFFDSDFVDRNEMFPYMDSVVLFFPNGNRRVSFRAYLLYELPFVQRTRWHHLDYNEYDSTGILISRVIDSWAGGHTFETFHPNGQIASRWIQGQAYVWGAMLGSMEWDSLGRKTREVQVAHSMRGAGPWRYEIRTITDFFPNGNPRRIRHWKSFMESDVCPCGEWLFFNESGEIIRREIYTSCDDYEYYCGDWQEEWGEDWEG